MEALHIACLDLAAGDDIASNASVISSAIDQAARAKTKVLLTPECALSGYPGAGRADCTSIDTSALADAENRLAIQAEGAGIALVLGSLSPWQDGWSNDALLCGVGGTAVRYRKQCITPSDQNHFLAGTETVVAERFGWKLGLSICFDIRFPDVWARQSLAGADCFLSIAHQAGAAPDPGSKEWILPRHYACRAAELATPLICCNAHTDDRWLDSNAHDGRGLPITMEHQDNLRLMTVIQPNALDPWYHAIRDQALERWKSIIRER